MKKQYNAPETMTMEVAMQNHLAFGTVTNLENNGDAAAKSDAFHRPNRRGWETLSDEWEEEEEE